MSNYHRSVAHGRRAAQRQKKMRQSKIMLAVALILILSGVGSLIWMSLKTAAPKPTTNSYGAPALAQQGGTVTDFSIGSLAGGNIALSDYAGDVIIMNFWATWCGPCQQELPEFERLQKRQEERGLKVITVSVDSNPKNAQSFVKRNNLQLTALWDYKKRLASAYDVEAMPSTYVIDRYGVIRYVHKGYSPAEFKRIVMETNELLDEM